LKSQSSPGLLVHLHWGDARGVRQVKTYELPDLLAVIDSGVSRNTRSLSFDDGAYLLHDTGVWLWLDEDKNLTDTERKERFETLGFPDITTNRQSVDGRTVWGIGPTTPLMPIPFTLEQLRKFDEVSCRAVTENLNNDDDADFDVEKIGVNASEVGRFLLFGEVPLEPPVANITPFVAAKPDVSLLATRKQLIDAFGSFTGIDDSWFTNLKDSPALQGARKVTGQGGRGHIAEPLFCPFVVLQWLINPNRRKGRKLSEHKGWEMFERHFPRAYAAYSVGDPRTD
jgi:hypothetical protein